VTCFLYGACFVVATLIHDGRLQVPAFLGPAGLTLLGCLAGRVMFDRFDRPAGRPDDARSRLVRWAVITNLASLATLVIVSHQFIDARFHEPAAPAAIASTALVCAGILLLARGKTAGLLLAMFADTAQALTVIVAPLGFPRDILGMLLLPGFVLALAVFFAYAGPAWRFLRAR
jgi:hypothetical protein